MDFSECWKTCTARRRVAGLDQCDDLQNPEVECNYKTCPRCR
jgi:hypothetical protein